jgi:hypothetical protein
VRKAQKGAGVVGRDVCRFSRCVCVRRVSGDCGEDGADKRGQGICSYTGEVASEQDPRCRGTGARARQQATTLIGW